MDNKDAKTEIGAGATEANDAATQKTVQKKNGRKKWPIVVGVIAVVLIVAGAGFWVWHGQPSFCNAICHVPMDAYNETYDQELGTAGVDKWGNEVENTAAMLCVSHKMPIDQGGAGATCMDCHVPTLSEQMSEGMTWVTGNYEFPLEERKTEDLVEARGLEPDEFCLNENCHNLTRDDLIEKTKDMSFNPHVKQHAEMACSECHKAHRASVNACTACHSEADVPDGWLTAQEAKKLKTE